MRKIVFLMGAIVCFAAFNALAQMHMGPGDRDYMHAENHDWYRGLMSPITHGSCCSGNATDGDCRQTRAYSDMDGQWHALVDGRWQIVPPAAILPMNSPDGNSHVCATASLGIICFLGGKPKS